VTILAAVGSGQLESLHVKRIRCGFDGQETSGDQKTSARFVDVEAHAPQAGFDGEVDNAGGAWAHPLRQ
jgi:hypothetical protein